MDQHVSMETNDAGDFPSTESWHAGSWAALPDLNGSGAVRGGAIAEAKTVDIEIIPITLAEVPPGRRLTREAFDTVGDEILAGLRVALSVDGMFLNLHGTMVPETHSDTEGLLLTAIHQTIGPDIPVVFVVAADADRSVDTEMRQ